MPRRKFEKGHVKIGGRVKGTPNRVTRTVREALHMSFQELGAERYLIHLANKQPKAYAALLAKTIPTEITGANGAPLQVRVVGGLPDDEFGGAE